MEYMELLEAPGHLEEALDLMEKAPGRTGEAPGWKEKALSSTRKALNCFKLTTMFLKNVKKKKKEVSS